MTQTKHKKGFKSLKSSLKIGMEHREGDVHEMHKNDILHENNFTETIKEYILDGHDVLHTDIVKEYHDGYAHHCNSPYLGYLLGSYFNEKSNIYYIIDELKLENPEAAENFLKNSGSDLLDYYTGEGCNNLEHGLLNEKSHNYEQTKAEGYLYIVEELGKVDIDASAIHLASQLSTCNNDVATLITEKIQNTELTKVAIDLFLKTQKIVEELEMHMDDVIIDMREEDRMLEEIYKCKQTLNTINEYAKDESVSMEIDVITNNLDMLNMCEAGDL
jgi:hypothetical protein